MTLSKVLNLFASVSPYVNGDNSIYQIVLQVNKYEYLGKYLTQSKDLKNITITITIASTPLHPSS